MAGCAAAALLAERLTEIQPTETSNGREADNDAHEQGEAEREADDLRVDPDFVGAFVAALRTFAGFRNRPGTPGADE